MDPQRSESTNIAVAYGQAKVLRLLIEQEGGMQGKWLDGPYVCSILEQTEVYEAPCREGKVYKGHS